MAGIGKGGREVPSEMRKGEALVRGLGALRVWREAFEKLGERTETTRDTTGTSIARVEA